MDNFLSRHGGHMFCIERNPTRGRNMKQLLLLFGICAGIFVLITTKAPATNIVITSLSGNGMITWTNNVTNLSYQVQWSSGLGQDWHGAWNTLEEMPGGTNLFFTAETPMFLRVVLPDRNVVCGEWNIIIETSTFTGLLTGASINLGRTGHSVTGGLPGVIFGERIAFGFELFGETWAMLGTIVDTNRMKGVWSRYNSSLTPEYLEGIWVGEKQ